jgi:hypothetical protein
VCLSIIFSFLFCRQPNHPSSVLDSIWGRHRVKELPTLPGVFIPRLWFLMTLQQHWRQKDGKVKIGSQCSSSFGKCYLSKTKNITMRALSPFSLVLLLLSLLWTSSDLVVRAIQVEPDGGYTGIVIKINEDVPEESCSDILQNLQVRPTKRKFLIWKMSSFDFICHYYVGYRGESMLFFGMFPSSPYPRALF